ncbi:hypothetical protein Hanom_Chr11g01032641 [Helianthus anomalus]
MMSMLLLYEVDFFFVAPADDKTTPPKKGKNHGLGSMLLIQFDDSLLGLGSMPFGVSLLAVIVVWFLLLPHGYQQQLS